jgi:predicted transcriptional regulator
MADLFTVENKIRIIELKTEDIERKSDIFKSTCDLIKSHQENYPDIEKWFKTKVLPEIPQKERAVFIGFNNDKPIATAIVKKGVDSKFCHLHIEKEMRHQNIGDIFFMLMATYVRGFAKRVHFSLPEGLWEDKKPFFNSFGFEKAAKYSTQYRSFEEELTCSVDFNTLWKKTLLKLPSLIEQFSPHPDSPLNGIVMSIRPNYSRQIMNGDKLIEIRKKFNPKWKNHKVTIYSSSPIKELVGYATINKIIEEKPESVWSCYSDQLGCSKSEFDNYTKGQEKVYAIFLSDVNKFYSDLSLNYLSNFLEKKIHPPQSYSSVKNTEWEDVISIAELLHGRFNCFSQVY